MKLWIDAQLSPSPARWITEHFERVDAVHVRDLGLRDAEDDEIFDAARSANAVVMSKDGDFVDLLIRQGPPPQVIWITCGNTSNARMRAVLGGTLDETVVLLHRGEWLVEISGA